MKRILKFIFIFLILLIIVSVFTFNHGVKTLYGGFTEEVDHVAFAVAENSLLIRNVNILSENCDSFITQQTVVVQDGLITEIDSSIINTNQWPEIDGSGKFLIPGLIDSHVHLFKSPNDLLLYVANGVTHVREMIGEPDHLEWREEIRNGRIGPELYVASPRFGSFGFFQGWFMEQTQGFTNVTSEQEAEQAVVKYHEKGYDGIKIYSHLNKASYQKVSSVSDALGMDVIGHIPFNIGLEDVWLGQQKEVAHFEEIMNALNREFEYYENYEKDQFYKFIDQRSDDIADYLLEKNIAVTSTLWGMQSLYRQKTDLKALLGELELKYVNPGITEGHYFTPRGGLGWLPGVNRVRFPEGLNEEEQKGRGDYWLIYAEACERVGKNLYDRGVTILAGTDANLSVKVPGFSLHDELVTLQTMGMTNTDILKSATVLPAKWLNVKSGQIKKGYQADLILLDQNPLENIDNTKQIYGVVLDGRYLDKPALNQILNAVEAANNQSRSQEINAF